MNFPASPDPTEQYYDNPNTPADETADNGRYILWGNWTSAHSWERAAFPAVLANCQACHTGSAGERRQLENRPLPRGLRFLP